MDAQVGNIKGVVVLDNEGHRLIAKYYRPSHQLETDEAQKNLEKGLFQKCNKNSTSKLNQYENDIFNIDRYVAVFRVYKNMSIYILGEAQDNEIILAQVLDTIHECFDCVFKHNIERKSLIQNMTAVILVIDELIDSGIVMAQDAQTVLGRINMRGVYKAPVGSRAAEETPAASTEGQGAPGGGMFASVFASAKSSLARTLQM